MGAVHYYLPRRPSSPQAFAQAALRADTPAGDRPPSCVGTARGNFEHDLDMFVCFVFVCSPLGRRRSAGCRCWAEPASPPDLGHLSCRGDLRPLRVAARRRRRHRRRRTRAGAAVDSTAMTTPAGCGDRGGFRRIASGNTGAAARTRRHASGAKANRVQAPRRALMARRRHTW